MSSVEEVVGRSVEVMRWLLLLPLVPLLEAAPAVEDVTLSASPAAESSVNEDLVGDAKGLSGKLCSALPKRCQSNKR